jgi:hypothetical protein
MNGSTSTKHSRGRQRLEMAGNLIFESDREISSLRSDSNMLAGGEYHLFVPKVSQMRPNSILETEAQNQSKVYTLGIPGFLDVHTLLPEWILA